MAAMLRTEWYTIKVQYRDESLGHFAVPGRSGAAWSSSRSAAHTLAQEKGGPVKRLAGLVEYAGE
jgi:hypothetical protein